MTSLGSDVAGVRFEGDMLFSSWKTDGSSGMPLTWSERLAGATPAQRARWELRGDGVGVHWPDVDEDLSAPGIVGLPD